MKASILGNPEIMVALYGAGADTDAPDLSGQSPLHCAVKDARLETVRWVGVNQNHGDIRSKSLEKHTNV